MPKIRRIQQQTRLLGVLVDTTWNAFRWVREDGKPSPKQYRSAKAFCRAYRLRPYHVHVTAFGRTIVQSY